MERVDLSFLVEGLTVLLNGREMVRVTKLDLSPGDIAWIDAPSGAGKSTLLKGLARLIDTKGSLSLGKVYAESIPAHEWRRRVTLLPFPPVPLGETIEADLLSPYKLAVRKKFPPPSKEMMLSYIESCGLGTYGLSRATDRLSQGELSRLAIVRTLLSKPQVLLLDEPTANIDEASRELLEGLISSFAEDGGVVIATGHSAPWGSVNRRFEITGGELRGAT
ncbi:MAG: hypothetical protein C0608_05245 [Deltaproteobacteria bacterium]|nr:MAG: hypothetical protein C0608_05245 [Deltaproteobacteria bacterium]